MRTTRPGERTDPQPSRAREPKRSRAVVRGLRRTAPLLVAPTLVVGAAGPGWASSDPGLLAAPQQLVSQLGKPAAATDDDRTDLGGGLADIGPTLAGLLDTAQLAELESLGPLQSLVGDTGDLLGLLGGATTQSPGASEKDGDRSSYSSTGEYLDYADRVSLERVSNTKLDGDGVIRVARGNGYVYNPVTIAQYGLQEWSYYQRTGKREHLNKAVRQAGWLVSNQDSQTSMWTYGYDFAVGGFDETLESGWGSAMSQGQAMSLLTRINSEFPDKPLYLKAARQAHRPLVKSVKDGGLVHTFKGRPYYEEYPTRSAPSLALNGFQFTLIGLYDLAQTGFPTAQELFDQGYETMVFALPYHDVETTTAYHLGHLTKPPRDVHHADHYHRLHVQLLRTLYEMRKDAEVERYAERWAAYPPCDDAPAQCGR